MFWSQSRDVKPVPMWRTNQSLNLLHGGVMNTVRNNPGAGALSRFESVNRDAGAFASEKIQAKASDFYQKLTYGSAFQEPMLRMRLALSSTARAEMSELWTIVLHPRGSGADSLQKLEGWMARNPRLLGSMSSSTQGMLKEMVAQKGTAQKLQTEMDQAANAVRQAFGAARPESTSALQELGRKAQVEGSVAASYSAGIASVANRVMTMLMPGARSALAQLQAAVGEPGIPEMTRRQRYNDWQQQHPNIANMLYSTDAGQKGTALLHENMRVADWSDGEYQKARQAALTALGQAAGA